MRQNNVALPASTTKPGLDAAYLSGDASDRDANEADVVDQAFVIPASDNDRDIDR